MSSTIDTPHSGARVIWQVTGKDRFTFLQRLITNDISPLTRGPGLIWTALLTPQGKYLADFFVARQEGEEHLLLDIDAALAPPTLIRLQHYRLRADVTIEEAPLFATGGQGPAPASAFADPRHPAFGWRAWGAVAAVPDHAALCVDHLVPEFPADLVPEETYILEAGFERLNGVSFRKGCFIGQEVTARMKHKAVLRRGLVRVRVDGPATPGSAITLEDGREAGRLGTRQGDRALAMLRLDRAGMPLFADGTPLRVEVLAGGENPP